MSIYPVFHSGFKDGLIRRVHVSIQPVIHSGFTDVEV